jgi:hypothetical protein
MQPMSVPNRSWRHIIRPPKTRKTKIPDFRMAQAKQSRQATKADQARQTQQGTKGSTLPKPDEIVAALANVSAIDS